MRRGMTVWSGLAMAVVLAAGGAACASDSGKPPKYDVHYRDTIDHEKSEVFDMSNPTHTARLNLLMQEGRVSRIRQEHIPTPMEMASLRWDLGLWALVVFGLLLFVLSRTAWPSMLEGLKKREQNIADAISSAERARQDSERIQKEMQAQMGKAHDDVRALMEEARKDASAAKEDMLAAAKKEIGAERDRLRREIETAKDQALLDIWNQSTQLAAMISSKTLKREIRPDDHKKLFDEAMAEFKSAKAGGTAGKA